MPMSTSSNGTPPPKKKKKEPIGCMCKLTNQKKRDEKRMN